MRGLELVRLGSNATAYLAVIASGNYRLLPYAIEFWIDHCSQYALGGGCLGLDRPLQRHLARLYEKHKDILHGLGLATPQAASPERAMKDHANEQIKLYSNIPIYGLMADILSLRHLVSQLDGDNSSGKFRLNQLSHHEPADELTGCIADIEAYVMNNDQTLFSRLAQVYESAVVYLLAQHEVPGITPAILRAFQKSYASTAFRCRFPHCERLSLGFPTAELRLEHETIHVQRLYCQIASCQYNRIGFGKRSALNAHTRKHHGQSNTLLIPAKVRRTTDAEAETLAHQPHSQPPDMNSDPSLAPPGMPPQLHLQNMPGPNGKAMMRPPSSHPQPPNFTGQQITPAQMEAMRRLQGYKRAPSEMYQDVPSAHAAPSIQPDITPLSHSLSPFRQGSPYVPTQDSFAPLPYLSADNNTTPDVSICDHSCDYTYADIRIAEPL
jgi:hypothetical protein